MIPVFPKNAWIPSAKYIGLLNGSQLLPNVFMVNILCVGTGAVQAATNKFRGTKIADPGRNQFK